ncbi:MAG: Mur ligase family protein [Patescibacteria group bacterium]|nr:Mur ligase family protein [Patescibacteria group bacterium]MCL5258108.1 Mur ligase family protein [Patescibacteria group bacterium]
MKRKIIIVSLRFWSKLILFKYKPKIIALTGSAGKSSAKELLYLILKEKYYVFRNHASLNNEIGVPLTILLIDWRPGRSLKNWLNVFKQGLKLFFCSIPYPKILIIETGVEHPNDMGYLLSLIKPEVGVFTALGDQPAHLQFFPTIESLVDEKGILIQRLAKTGLAILNRDDKRIWSLREKTAATVFSFGFDQKADAIVKNVSVGVKNGLDFELTLFNQEQIELNFKNSVNESLALNAAATCLIGNWFGLTPLKMKESFAGFQDLPGRLKLFRPPGQNFLIIDDSYNASPISYQKLIGTVKKLPGRKIAVFGDVLEADSAAEKIHRQIAQTADDIFETVVLIGPRLKLFAAPIFQHAKILIFEPNQFDQIHADLIEILQPDDLIIFKAARAFHLEKLIKKFIGSKTDLVDCFCEYRPNFHSIKFDRNKKCQ